jgi:hypothetical protein
MYIFSVTGVARKAMDDIEAGQSMPFIVYINFKDLFGAEQLCKIYLYKSGFTDVEIEKRKLVEKKLLDDPRVLAADKVLKDALDSGYSIQMFDED